MANTKKDYGDKKDYHQELTDRTKEKIDQLIKDMQADPNKQWNKTWFACNERPENPFTGTKYKGINVISLLSADFVDNRFYTYNNIAEMEKIRAKNVMDMKTLSTQLDNKEITHAQFDVRRDVIEKSFLDLEAKGLNDRTQPIHVIKGSKAVPVFKAIQMEYKKGESGDELVESTESQSTTNKVWMQVFAGNVFNASQISNIKPKHEHTLDFVPHAEAEIHLQAMIAKTGLKYNETDQGRAYYSQNEHSVNMPLRESFNSVNDFYGVLMHEIGHSTGKELGRDMSGGFGSKSYAFEELVADISSNLMSSDLGIPYNPSQHENHVAYLQSWSKALGEDKKFIFKAASKAERSVEFQHAKRAEYKIDLALKLEDKNDLKVVVEPTVSNQIKNKPKLAMA